MDNTGHHSRGRRCDRCMTEVFAAVDNTGYHSRGRRCDRYMTEVFAAADNTRYHSRSGSCDRCTRDIIAGAAAVALRWGGKGWHVGIYAIALGEAIAAQTPKPTTGVAESVKPPWLSRRAHLRLMPGSSASLAPDSRSWAAVMFPINFHRSVLSGGGGGGGGGCRLKKTKKVQSSVKM